MEQDKLNFNICLAIKHSYRVLYARGKMKDFFPLTTASKYHNLSDEEIEHIDQFVYRFQKLQDDIKINMYSNVYEDTKMEINQFYETLKKSDFSDLKG